MTVVLLNPFPQGNIDLLPNIPVSFSPFEPKGMLFISLNISADSFRKGNHGHNSQGLDSVRQDVLIVRKHVSVGVQVKVSVFVCVRILSNDTMCKCISSGLKVTSFVATRCPVAVYLG